MFTFGALLPYCGIQLQKLNTNYNIEAKTKPHISS